MAFVVLIMAIFAFILKMATSFYKDVFRQGFLLVFSILVLSACSSQKTSTIAVGYHNMTARYNAYFIAKERIKEIQTGIRESQDHNYDEILTVYPALDSNMAVAYASQIEDCIKKSSLIIEFHQNSKWVDDAYNLLGLGRLYAYEHTHAIETFKFVNTNSTDEDTRHRALVNLMYTFIEYGEMNNAIAVSDYLQKEDLNKENQKNLYLMRAWYYQNREDYDPMVQNLVLANPILTSNDNKARINFIIGQVYQHLGFDSEAFNYYKRTLTSSPKYELSFYAKLNMAQVTQLNEQRDIRNVEKYFKKLVKDAKNIEFKDKIYYEWGRFDLKQGQLAMAIDKFNLSIRESLSNPRQKGLSYLTLAEIYYDSLTDYSMAKVYYDSTVQTLPRDYEGFDDIQTRQQILDEFVQHLNTIQREDSLLSLAKLDSSAVMNIIDEAITKEELEAEEEAQKQEQRREARSSSLAFETSGIGTGASTWYFDNPAAISLGSSEFRKIWGDRLLEDHWRRSLKTTDNVFDDPAASEEITDIEDLPESGVPENDGNSRNRRRTELYATIPKSAEDQSRSLQKIEESYYRLGNIYYFDLKETENSLSAFETLIQRFPNTENKPEVLYQLYLINQDLDIAKSEFYKNELITQFPETTYARLITNPNFQQESVAINEVLKKDYERAYRLYLDKDYEGSQRVITSTVNEYPDAPFTPNLILLNILIIGKTADLHEYQIKLDEFIEEYPDSDVTDYARTLRSASDNYKEGLIKLKEAEFISDADDIYYFIVVYSPQQEHIDKISVEIESFNLKHFEEQGLKTGSLKLDEQSSIILVNEFQSIESVLYYYDLFLAEQNIRTEFPSLKFDNFVISKSNFNILYETKELDTYRRFYSTNY